MKVRWEFTTPAMRSTSIVRATDRDGAVAALAKRMPYMPREELTLRVRRTPLDQTATLRDCVAELVNAFRGRR